MIIGVIVDPEAFRTTSTVTSPDIHPDAQRVVRAMERARDLAPEHDAHETAQTLAGRTADKLGIAHEGVQDALTASILVATERALVVRERRRDGRSANEGHGLKVYYDAAVTAWRKVKP